MTRTIRLTERRSMVCRLPRADAAALVADWRHVVEVAPTADPDRYRVTARGWAGSFRTPGRAWEVVPKLGWAAVRRLSDGVPAGGGDDTPNPAALRSVLADRLAGLMAERATAGLVRGYAEAPEHSAVVRGRIDLPATARLRAGGQAGFAQVVDEFTADQPWNGWPLGVARQLLDGPLDVATRAVLTTAADRFGDIRPRGAADRAAWASDLRLAAYRPLHDWCGVVSRALAGGGLLLHLERLFEDHLGRLLAVSHRGRRAVVHRPVALRTVGLTPAVEFRPDLTVLDPADRPLAVWDAKWKRLGPTPDPADLHQVLGYAAMLGVRSAGLVYPGRRFSAVRYNAPSGVTVTVATCRLTGDEGRVRRAADRLRRLVLRP